MAQQDCPFCHLAKNHIFLESALVTAFFDAYPVAAGHALVVPNRHVTSLFDLPEDKQAAVWLLVHL
jgi:histidine triad (HIT) family protein